MSVSEKEIRQRKRRRLALLVIILIPVLLTSRIFRHKKIEETKAKIGFHEAAYDRQGKLLPWIDPNIAHYCQRIINIQDGQIVSEEKL